MTPNAIMHSKSWCKKCYNDRRSSTQIQYTIKDMNQIARERGGKNAKCLSPKYLGAHKKLVWLCPVHGTFQMAPNNVRIQKSWCHKCADSKRRLKSNRGSIEELRKIANKRGGKLLSNRYINQNTKYEFVCKYGHPWMATAASIKHMGSWCPKCNTGAGEVITRIILSRLFDDPFNKDRPSWLINPKTNRALELDGYSERLGIAFEYQGEQHYKADGFLIKSEKQLLQRKELDHFKVIACKNNKVKLLVIEESIKKRSIDKLKAIIARELKINRVPFSIEKLKSIELGDVDLYTSRTDIYKKILESTVEKKNGIMLTVFISSTHPMKFKCSNKHTFTSRPTYVVNGSWCKECAKNENSEKRRFSILEVKKVSLSKGFVFLSTRYDNARVHYHFKCIKCEHIKTCAFDNIQSGSGCPKCKKNLKYTIEDCRRKAKSKGGKCLSLNYLGARSKLRWECKHGHKWNAQVSSVMRGSWCQKCYNERRKSF